MEENCRLYNEVQDLKGAIRVFCRVRPPGTTGDDSASMPLPLFPISGVAVARLCYYSGEPANKTAGICNSVSPDLCCTVTSVFTGLPAEASLYL